jgi:RHS repeat-associated protein
MTKAVQSGTTVQMNAYDGDGNRVQQVAGGSTFTYSYQGLNILYEKNVTGGTTTITKHFYAGGLQVAKMVGTGVYYLHQDALGSTRVETSTTVTVKFSSNYVPYGGNYAVSGKESFTYTGKPYDSTTGLYYYGARYYDPTTGRFATQDTNVGKNEDPLTLNLYIYARDNPERYVDPTGHYIGHVSIIPDNQSPDPYATITTTCQNGVCVDTYSERAGPYSSQWTTVTGTETDPSGVRRTAWLTSNVETDSNSISTATTHSTTTVGPDGLVSTATTTQTSSRLVPTWGPVVWNPNAAGAIAILVGGTIATTASVVFFGNPVLFAGSAQGTFDVFTYLYDNPNPDPSQAAQDFISGFIHGATCEFFHVSC